jgi:hypothetical protein
LHLNLTQHGDDLLGAEPLPSGHLRLLSFQVNLKWTLGMGPVGSLETGPFPSW